MNLRWYQWLVPVAVVGLGAWLASVGAPALVVAIVCGLFLVPWFFFHISRTRDARARRAGLRGSMLGSWALLAVSLVLCLGGALGLDRNPGQSLVIMAFFGGCAAMFAFTIRGQLREREFKTLAVGVSVEGGRNIPMNLTYLLSIAGGMLVVGAGIAMIAPPIVAACGVIAALAGLSMFVLWALGLFRQYLRFDPEGLTFGTPRYEFQVPWDSVVAIRTMEIHDNPFVMLSVGELSALKVTPPRAARKLYKRVLRSGIVIPPYHYGMEPDPLLALLERYVRDPAARAELAPKPAAPVLLDAPKA